LLGRCTGDGRCRKRDGRVGSPEALPAFGKCQPID
jgi:hypothetical protein